MNLKAIGFNKFTNSFRSTEMALFASVPQIALKYNIKLIFWGENPALQLGDMKALGLTGYDGNNLRYMNTLSSGIQWMLESGYRESDLIPYMYPTPSEFEENDLQIVYLGWFLGDWSLVNNANYSCGLGLEIRTDGVEKTGDLYGVTALDEDFTPINQMIKFYKFGFGRVTDYGYEDNRLTKFELDHFVALARNHNEVKEIAERIVKYRQYDEIYELEKLLKQKSTMDTRFYKILSNISSFTFSPEAISIPDDKLSDIENKVAEFVNLLDSNQLITFIKENPAKYRDMLYSDKSLLQYHSE
jgi:hypothetical protein